MRNMILLCLFLILWQVLTAINNMPPFLLPSPLCIVEALWMKKNYLLHHGMVSILEVIMGLFFGLCFAIFLSVLMDYSKNLARFLIPYLILLKNIPIFIVAPLLMFWCGHGLLTKAILISLSAMFPMTIAFYDGLKSASNQHHDFLKTLPSYSWVAALWFIRAPYASFHGLTGCRLAFMHAPMSVIACDWIGASEGLGYVMMLCYGRLDLPLMMATLIVLIMFSLLFYKTCQGIEVILKMRLHVNG